jgi:hypothetical protein
MHVTMSKTDELKVFISSRDSTCDECQEELGRSAWIMLAGERGALCLDCADLDHLAFLPSGNATLTRRTKKYSRLYAVVLKWSRARKRYERKGLLVEAEALTKAEEECLADEEVRRRKRERDAIRREELDVHFVERFAQRIRELFPGCPAQRERTIAEFACRKYSRRVGRSAAAKEYDEKAVRLAVIAHVRHTETDYDEQLGLGQDRFDARRNVQSRIERVLADWET